MSDIKEKGRTGTSFDDFLKSEGRYEEATEQAVKRVVAQVVKEDQCDQIRAEKIAHMQRLVTKGIESGATKSTSDEILAQARKMADQKVSMHKKRVSKNSER